MFGQDDPVRPPPGTSKFFSSDSAIPMTRPAWGWGHVPPCSRGYAIGLSVCLSHAASSKTVLLSADITRGRDVKFRESRCQQTIFVSMEQSLLIYCYV